MDNLVLLVQQTPNVIAVLMHIVQRKGAEVVVVAIVVILMVNVYDRNLIITFQTLSTGVKEQAI
jgi:hypothetical protein